MHKAMLILVLSLLAFTPIAQAEVLPTDGVPAAGAQAEAPAPAAELDMLLQGEAAGDGCAAEQLSLNPEPIYQSACTDNCVLQRRACRQSCNCPSKPCACLEWCIEDYQLCVAGC